MITNAINRLFNNLTRLSICHTLGLQDLWKIWLESFLDENYNNPDLKFEDLMRHFRFSRSYGCQLFKRHLGKTFLEKLREIRIMQAQNLIKETSMLIYEIASQCGFRSSKHLCETFNRIHGISPIYYRRKVNKLPTKFPEAPFSTNR